VNPADIAHSAVPAVRPNLGVALVFPYLSPPPMGEKALYEALLTRHLEAHKLLVQCCQSLLCCKGRSEGLTTSDVTAGYR
jgi:hypothetical protein